MLYKITSLLLLLPLHNLHGQNMRDAQYSDLKSQVKLLASPQTTQATNAFDILYTSGNKAIPFLIDKFNDKTNYVGICGASAMTSQADACEKKKTLPDGSIILDCHNQGHPEFGAPPKVRDVALYLLISILKSDRNHSKTCTPKSNNYRDLRRALYEIKKLYIKSHSNTAEFNIIGIEAILKKHSIVY